MSTDASDGWRPRLRPEIALRADRVRGESYVVAPERVARLNATAEAILALCDGHRSVEGIIDELQARYPEKARDALADSVDVFLLSARRERWLV